MLRLMAKCVEKSLFLKFSCLKTRIGSTSAAKRLRFTPPNLLREFVNVPPLYSLTKNLPVNKFGDKLDS